MACLVTEDATDGTVFSAVPYIVPNKPNEGIPCRHVCPKNANLCVELERVQERIDRCVYCKTWV